MLNFCQCNDSSPHFFSSKDTLMEKGLKVLHMYDLA